MTNEMLLNKYKLMLNEFNTIPHDNRTDDVILARTYVQRMYDNLMWQESLKKIQR